MIDLVSFRTHNSKIFDLGEGIRQCIMYCSDIHYKPYQRDNYEWETINSTLRNDITNNMYISSDNKFSVGFRSDGDLNKFMGIRRVGNNNIQLEMTYDHIRIDGGSISLPEKFLSMNSVNNTIDHVIDNYISINTELTNFNLSNSVKVARRVVDFEIIFKIHCSGVWVENDFYTLDNVKYYIPDSDNKFYFSSDEETNTLWIGSPKMWNSQSTSYDIEHQLYEKEGYLYYKKTPNEAGNKWLSYSRPYIFIDANVYWGNSGYGFVRTNNNTWSTARDATTGSSVNTTSTTDANGVEGCYRSKTYYITRSFFQMDTSNISSFDWIQAASFHLYGASSSYTVAPAILLKGTQATTLTTADFDSFNTSAGYVTAATSTWSSSNYNSFTFTMQNIDNIIVRSGTTKVCIREYTHDYQNSTPTTTDGIDGVTYAGANINPYLMVYLVPAHTILHGMPF